MKTKPSKSSKKAASPAAIVEPAEHMLFLIQDDKPIAYIGSDDKRPDGRRLLTIAQTVERFGYDPAFWANHWQGLLGSYAAPDAESPELRRARAEALELSIGQIVFDKSREAAFIVTTVDDTAFVGLAIAGSGPTLGKRYGCDLSDVSEVCPVTIFEIADSLRKRADATTGKAGAK